MRFAIAMCMLITTGCSKSSASDSSPATDGAVDGSGFDSPPIRLTMTPGDVLTDVGATPIVVELDHSGGNVPDAVVQGVSPGVKLRTYPELAPVPFTQKNSSRGDDETAPKDIVVTPASPLARGWYVLSVDAVPTGVAPFSATAAAFPQLGAAISRFCTGSSPVLRTVTLASNGKVIVTFSEGVLADPAKVATAITVKTPDAAACTLLPTDFPNPSMQIGFQCSASAWQTKHVTLIASSGLQTPGGSALGYLHTSATSAATLIGYDALTQDIDFSSLPEASNARSWPVAVP